jgi:hypothetical protein
LTPDSGPQAIFVKIPREWSQTRPETSWTAPKLIARGRQETESLKWLYERIEGTCDARLRALRPLGYIAALNAIITEAVPGRGLDYCFWPWRPLPPKASEQARIAELCEVSGQWLRHIHSADLTCENPRPKTQDAILLELQSNIDLVEQAGIDLPYGLIRQEILAQFSSLPHDPLVTVHNDFVAHNILITPENSVVVFDTALDFRGSRYIDIGAFVAGLMMQPRWPVTPAGFAHDAFVERCIEGFLKGYFRDQPIDTERLNMYVGRALFSRWGRLLRRIRNETFRRTPGLARVAGRVFGRVMVRRSAGRWIEKAHKTAQE